MVLLLLGGRVTAASRPGRRDVPAAELFVGPMESSLRHDELAVEAFFPALAAGRRGGDRGGVPPARRLRAVRAWPPRSTLADGAVSGVRAGYFSVCDVPTVVDLTAPLGRRASPTASLADAADLALAALDPADDIHATAAYRAQLVRTLTAACRRRRARRCAAAYG